MGNTASTPQLLYNLYAVWSKKRAAPFAELVKAIDESRWEEAVERQKEVFWIDQQMEYIKQTICKEAE